MEGDAMKTLKEAAKAALDCQDACTLSGVVFSFAKAMQIICDEGYDTARKNTHPIVYLFVDKLADLCGVPHLGAGPNQFRANYEACAALAEVE
jgi:hypothetical protein